MTEKDYNAQQRTSKTMNKQSNVEKAKPEVKEEKKKETAEENKVEEKKTPVVKKKIEKKEEAVVNGVSLPLSTKKSVAICKFIRGKSIDRAIADLEEVENMKKAIPMTGEIPHRKGKRMMSGRYMTKTVGYMIKLLKSLKSNSSANGIEEPVIAEAIPNRASRPRGRFGSIQRKRTHIFLKAVERKKIAELKNKDKKK